MPDPASRSQAGPPYCKNKIAILERIQRMATKMITTLRQVSYEEKSKECKLTLETRG